MGNMKVNIRSVYLLGGSGKTEGEMLITPVKR